MIQRVAAVIPARNEENFIDKTLAALFDRHKRPGRVIVVNDDSTDRTAKVAAAACAEVVVMPDRGYNVQGTPVLAGSISPVNITVLPSNRRVASSNSKSNLLQS
ncbi:MAG TPA: glycosyltransferase [Nitrososphaera sp.]|nr:glycosyltransferase [Nitrososphaera sp.]